MNVVWGKERERPVLVACLLFMLALAVMAPVVNNGFISFDDDLYITGNPAVSRGLTWSGVRWAFTKAHAHNWHPLTWMSHMLDSSVYGLNPAGHHLTSLLLHAATTCLLFAFLRRASGALWLSAWVAAVFAVHPLHVESVAWASERKDVLSGFLAVGVMLAYVSYAKKPGWGRYLGVLTLYALGLMAKQMLVTLPFLLLLLDYWPLRRLKSGVGNDEGGHTSLSGSSAPVGARQIVLEKIPLLALAVLASVIVFQVQTATGVVKSLDVIPLGMRSGNAVLSYVRYLWKILFPVKLAIFYPYPQPPLPLWQPAGAGFLLLLLAGVGLAVRKSHPYLMVGWGWFLGMLIPVIGLVQVGVQSMADRYAYLPAMGVYVIVAWGVRDLAIKLRVRVQVAVALALLGLLACGVVTRIQVAYWRNSMTLYAHACDVVPGNYWAHYNLGVEMERQGRGDEALAQYAEAVRIKPDFPEAHYNMGVALAARGRRGDAARHYLEAIRVKPRYARALCNLAAIVAEQGNLGEATRYYERALQADSRLAEAHIGLGIISEAQGDIETAVFRYREALRIRPDWECAADRLRNSLTRLPSKAHSKEPR